MKKTNYINKYDFINYFSKPKYFWFLSNSEITSIIEAASNKYYLKNNLEYEENEITNDEDEYDAYEIYCQAKESNEKIDDNNPKIFEGRIIDDESKTFVKKHYFEISKVIDFDDSKYRAIKQEEISIITKEKILENDEIILFQPVFIYKNQITKPDAVIKIKNEIHIIETKGTSSTRIVHFLDLLFQKKTIEIQSYLSNYEFEYKLCVIEYCKLNKNNVSFSITDHFNYKKSFFLSKKNENISDSDYLEMKKNLKLGIDIDNKSFEDYSLKLNHALNGHFSNIIYKKEVKPHRITATSIDKAISNMNLAINKFDRIISEMDTQLTIFHKNWKEHSEETNVNLIIEKINLALEDKNPYKPNDFFVSLKPIYIALGFKTFLYSGNTTKQDYDGIKDLIDLNSNGTVEPIFKTPSNNPNFFSNLFSSNSEDIQINHEQATRFIKKIKRIKVFFDFETINTAIRSVDNSYPFTQVVTQCSILKIEDKKELYDCDNLICDPKSIDLNWYMKIIDSLYMSDKLMDETSYIVYNKTFEDSRLREIGEYLNKDYKMKIEKIRSNIIDLADLFRISSNKGYIIFIKKLCGFYSIKKVLPIIEEEKPELWTEAKCKNYKILEVSNGKICQEKTALRFFGAINDKEWSELSLNLQKYCENDVRAMWAIELYVRSII